MQYTQLIEKYQEIRSLTHDHEAWMNSSIGGDLWIDGLQIFLTVEPADFKATYIQYVENYTYNSHSFIQSLNALHQFTVDCANESEFELYKALALGMTWLSLYPHYQSDFFNVPGRITNHSIALLLSPTYQAIWITSYNEGLTLYIADKTTSQSSFFHPEQGRIYQNHQYFRQSDYVNFPYQSYFHEMAHILFCYDLYSRTLGDENEERSYLTHMETSIIALEETVLSELISVRDDLHVTHDGFNGSIFPEFAEHRLSVMRGEIPTVSARSLQWFTKAYMQLETENNYISDNQIKRLVVANHSLTEEEISSIMPPYQPYIDNIQQHSPWGICSEARKHIAAYREVIELMEPDSYCITKLQESMHPDTWPTPLSLLSKPTLPEPNPCQREQKKQLWRWREAYARLAKIRGYIEMEAPFADALLDVQHRLLIVAKRNARHLNAHLSAEDTLLKNHSGEIMPVENMLREVRIILCGLRHTSTRELLLSMLDEPFMHVLEPR
ncbi:hypothetical protein C2W64_04134 [Brevibacillus laterosporus]|nr:hypothetical protein [Brevibacillus laterosporus]RAP29187.1 hypothetical protein C2W64_04134 [Brevibacillus laterosporus]